MDACSHTGLAKPECSCAACVQAQIEQYMPEHLQAKAAAAPGVDSSVTPLSEPRRRAA